MRLVATISVATSAIERTLKYYFASYRIVYSITLCRVPELISVLDR